MKNHFIFVFFFCCLSTNVFSQEYEIKGSILDLEKNAIVFANVLLLKGTDSTVVNGTSTDDKGVFVLTGISKGKYFLKASYTGNVSPIKTINVTADTDVGILTIAVSQQLDEAIVTYQKPKLERKVDRFVFNVENTALVDGSLWDLLKHVPSVNDIQGVLTIKGNSDITVMINSRKINLPENDILNLLSGTSASNVESVEVITNPPSKYDAEGGMMIDIKMSKNLIAGYNGSLFNRYKQGVFAKHSLGTDHYFKGNKSDFSFSYSYGKEKNIRRHKDGVNFFEPNNTFSTWTIQQDYLRRVERHGLNAYYDYQFSEKSRLSLATINSWNPNNSRLFDTQTTIVGDTNAFNDFNTINNSAENTLNTSFYADYVKELRKDNTELSIGTHYTYYEYDRMQDLTNDFLDADGNVSTTNDLSGDLKRKIELYTARFDYKTPIGSLNFETGIRYAGITSESNNEQNVLDRSQLGVDLVEIGKFNYNESIYACYFGINGKKDKWNYKGGLRAEYTHTRGVFDSERADVNNDYFELFPSFSLQYTLSEDHDFKLWYYRRINRPRFVIANPFQYFQTNNSVFEGNPNILPSTRHYVAASYNFAQNYTVEVFYRNQNNPIREVVRQDNEVKTLLFQQANLISNISYGVDFMYTKNFNNFWNTYFYLSLFDAKFRFTDDLTNSIIENSNLTWALEFNNSFVFLEDKSLFLDVNFWYNNAMPIANATQEDWGSLTLSVRKSLWNKKASISLAVEDIFNQNSSPAFRRYSDQDNFSDYRFESRLFTFGFRYRFGNVGIKSNKKTKRTAERRRI